MGMSSLIFPYLEFLIIPFKVSISLINFAEK